MFELPPVYADVKDKVAKEFVFDPRGRWRTPAINSSPVCRPTSRSRSVIIHDDTLREGLNNIGAYPSLEAKLRIAQKLEEAGVQELEGGYPDIIEHGEFIRELKRSSTKMQVSAVIVNGGGDFRTPVEAAINAGADQLHMFALQLSYAMSPKLDLKMVTDLLRDSIKYGKERGKFVSVGPVGITSFDMIRELALVATDAGADRLYINDSQGCYTPEAVSYLVKFMRDIAGDGVEIAFHGHDDYDLATINAVQAVIAGANVVDTSVNRMCHRSGLAGFAEVVLALETLYDIRTGIDVAKITEVCQTVEKEFEIPIPPNNPHTGSSAYLTLGYHGEIAGDNRWWVWENIKAEAIGQERSSLWTPTVLDRGGMNGAVANKIKGMGFAVTREKLDDVFGELRKVFLTTKSATSEQVEKVIRKVYAHTA